ncbi:MAG: beta-lactamase family protein [Sandaracinaceae bacterium]|jgi:CubicO group peptidase (beta-lactamase class C family)|nr:beta-lactamase family protein [Sandaracinaceae bacterium]MBP7681563.1 beta-lactamase family protein [Deltaproteobacteria bacterium]MBK7150281.1 beta-lactamase family protein [Sandaracinaceae bacterium]MBK7774347.1 beta-lactamase family protein [Sandaracinaceae bacterium]MBK8408881.1 beta-lactamase family protein [Sandaracinaceae bacterium]
MPLRRFLALPSTWSLLTLVSVLALVPAASCGEGTGPAPELDFSAFDTALEAFLLENELEGANVVIVHRDWGVVHQRAFGSFTLDRISLLASASKILSVGVIMRLHDEGVLDIDAPISTYAPVASDTVMGWEGDRSMTLAQMLSNSSGMVGLVDDPTYPDYLCQYAFLGTLQSCGRNIYQADDADDLVPPDTQFRYGGGQWQLAGAIAELASGKSWAELVQETYVDPCGLETLAYTNQFAQAFADGGVDAALGYPTFFDGDISVLPFTRNPSIEGGGYTTVADYGEVLLMHLRQGVCSSGERVLSRRSVARMQEDRILAEYNGTSIDPTMPGYGMGWWVSRSEPGVVSDGGAYGAMPWLDVERGYGVMILIEADAEDGAYARIATKPILDAIFDAAD